MTVLFFFFFVINLIAFVSIGYDKFLAKNQKRRISERTLLSFVFLGGTFGSGIAMLFFRHKTAKKSYLWKFWLLVSFQIGLLFLVYYFELLGNKI
jgi:uncharacterized membrane protein YsdA (DUF1294 family)